MIFFVRKFTASAANFLFCVFLLQVGMVNSQDTVDCEQAFIDIRDSGDPFDITDKINRLEKLTACQGSGVYEARLAKLYSYSNKNTQALDILKLALDKGLPNDDLLKLTLFEILFAMEQGEEAGAVANELVRDYPDWSASHLSMAHISLAYSKTSDVISYAKKSIELEENAKAYVLMVLAYYTEERYREAAISMQRALKLDRNVLSETPVTCAAAYSLVALGYIAEAEELLVKHLDFTPEAKDDRTYQEALAVVKAQSVSN